MIYCDVRTKEQYYEEVVLKNREFVKTHQFRCACPNTLCDWHGKCRECVAIHRCKGKHVPFCLQSMLRDKIEALAGVVECNLDWVNNHPQEHEIYKQEMDEQNKN